jgi:hypothetical protein
MRPLLVFPFLCNPCCVFPPWAQWPVVNSQLVGIMPTPEDTVLGMVAHTCNTSTREAGRLQMWGQPGLHSETLSQRTKIEDTWTAEAWHTYLPGTWHHYVQGGRHTNSHWSHPHRSPQRHKVKTGIHWCLGKMSSSLGSMGEQGG